MDLSYYGIDINEEENYSTYTINGINASWLFVYNYTHKNEIKNQIYLNLVENSLSFLTDVIYFSMIK